MAYAFPICGLHDHDLADITRICVHADGANITDFLTDSGSALLNALPLSKEAFHTYKAAEDADDAAKAARLAAVEAQLQAFQAEIDLLKRQVNNGSSGESRFTNLSTPAADESTLFLAMN